MTTSKPWIMTNGEFDIEMCDVCKQPIYSGHVDCTCPQNHPERCERPGYEELTEILEHVMPVYEPFEYPREPEEIIANSRRIAGDNADIAIDALGQLAEAQERIVALEEALREVTEVGGLAAVAVAKAALEDTDADICN